MGKGGRVGNKQYGNRRIRSKDKGSDESDEDYTVGADEEFDDSEDYCSSLAGEESEEILGEWEEEEEEEKVRKVGRSKGRKGYQSRKKNGVGKAPKRRRVSYKEENDEDYEVEDYEYDDGDDDEFTPDLVDSDDEDELVVKKKNKKALRTPLQERDGGGGGGGGGGGDDDDDEFTPDLVDSDDDELVVRKKNKKASRLQERGDGGEFTPDLVDSDDDELVVRKKKKKASRLRFQERGGDDDDDEFTPDLVDSDDDELVVKKKNKKVSRPPLQGRGDDDEDDDEFTPDLVDSDDSDELVVRKNSKKASRPTLQGRGDDDEDDDEFTPDLVDSDYSDEFVVRKKSKKALRPPLQERGFVKGKKRKRNSKVVKKPARKKLANSHGLRRNTGAGNDRAFTKKNPVVKERSEKSSGPRKRRLVIDSDSDIVYSRSSDFEYTISEEEREQVREASEFCGDLANSLGNSSSKKIFEEEGVLLQQRKRLGRKGKEKIEELKIEVGKQVCGICLTEEGKKTVRGTLNCCSHYFCFPCILEWSKVESRCPLCKQRFVTISKPAKSNSGFDLRTVMVQIPERDQVYQPSEEELRGFLDPYENVICTECQQGGDDALMLLCDLCDSPAHTYCVGLGHEVPEGNWYCEGCRPTALGSSNSQAPNPTPDQRTTINLSAISSPVENVRETIDLNAVYVPETPLTQGTAFFSSPRHLGGDFQAASPVSGVGVLTVSERRRIQRQIHHLLNHRMSQLGARTNEISATTLGNNLLRSQIGRGRELEFQHAIPSEALSSQHNFAQTRLQDNFTPLVQSRDLFPARLNHSGGQRIQDQASFADGSTNGMLQAGLAGINMGASSRLGYEQLHPCNSRSRIDDANMSSYRYREATVPSRTFQGTLHTPF